MSIVHMSSTMRDDHLEDLGHGRVFWSMCLSTLLSGFAAVYLLSKTSETQGPWLLVANAAQAYAFSLRSSMRWDTLSEAPSGILSLMVWLRAVLNLCVFFALQGLYVVRI